MHFSIIRFFENFVEFRAEGIDCEKLLNSALKSGTIILNPRKQGYILMGNVKAKNYFSLAGIAKKMGIKIRVLKKTGPLFLIRKQKPKLFLVTGTALAFLFIMIMNSFIWEIEVYGNAKVAESDILQSAYSAGFRTGTLRTVHNEKAIEWKILNENDMLAWVTVNIVGCKAEIKVTEVSSEAEMMPDDDKPVNIVASKSGVIRSMDVFDGFAKVAVGDIVNKGDLLVGAVFEDRYNKLTLKHARAEVIAETDYSLSASVPLTEIKEEKSDKVGTSVNYVFLGVDYSFGKDDFPENYVRETENGDYYFIWIKLPLSRIITKIYSVKENSFTYSTEEASSQANYLLMKKELEEMKNFAIISKKTEEIQDNNNYTVNAEYICLMNIAEEQDVLSDIPWENTDDMS